MSRYSGWDERAVALKQIAAKPNKYGAKRVQVDGIWFDSKREAARYNELKLMRDAGLIAKLTVHPRYVIQYRDRKICEVELDFYYYDDRDRTLHYEDVKGKDNPLSALKRKLVEAFYGIKVEVLR